MNTHNICFCGEVRKLSTIFGRKLYLVQIFALPQIKQQQFYSSYFGREDCHFIAFARLKKGKTSFIIAK